MDNVVSVAKGQGVGSKRPRGGGGSGAIKVIVTEEDADPEKSRVIYNVPGWSHVAARDRAALILNQLGWKHGKIGEALGVEGGAVTTALKRADPDGKLRRTPRDVFVAKVLMYTQLEVAAMEHITPQKLKAESAKNLAVIAAMMADKSQKFLEDIIEYDKAYPEARPDDEGDLMARSRAVFEVPADGGVKDE